MKPRIFEKNGLPSSLGMLMIVLIIGLVCLVQCILTQPVHAQNKPQVEYVQVEPEPEIQLEEWMLNPGYWNNDRVTGYLNEEPDPGITIEPWMTDFSIPSLVTGQKVKIPFQGG